MKKQIKIIFTIVLISIISYLGYSIVNKINKKKETAEHIQTIPKFSFRTINGEVFTQKNISKSGAKLFIYFNSNCDFCKNEAKQIHKELDQLKDVQLLFVSFEKAENIKIFANKYSLLDQQNVFFLEDEKLIFAEIFDVQSIPFMLLYSKDNQLIKKFKGAVKIENVIKYLE